MEAFGKTSTIDSIITNLVNGQSQTALMPTTTVNNLRFPGQIEDGETGTFYNYYRDYQASTGRYLQSDPVGLAGGLNRYGYVGGNPLGWFDPDGLTQCDIDTAYEIVKRKYPELNFGKDSPVVDLPRNGPEAGNSQPKNQGKQKNIPGRDGNIHLNKNYLDKLSDPKAVDLVDTIIHEALHLSRDPIDQMPPTFDHGFIVPETERLVQGVKSQFLNDRAKCK